MGPAVFVLRESTSRSMKQLRADRPGEEKEFYCRRGPPQGGGEGTGRETAYGQDGQNPGRSNIQKIQDMLKKYHSSIVNALYQRREIVKNMQKNTIYI